ncbi:MAG: PRC-barrel domain-containing protein [Bacillota bacterium]
MLKGREIRGLTVSAGRKKEYVGRVRDLIIDDQSGQVLGLVVTDPGMWQKSFFIKMENIKLLSKKGVYVPNKANVKRLRKDSTTLLENNWLGSKLLSNKGEDKGTIADVLIKNGMVSGLEVSVGLVGDLHKRRDFIPWQNVRQKGNNFVEGVFHQDPLC